MAKIKSIKINWPTTQKGMEELQKSYTKAVAKVLVKNYPPEVIEELIKKLSN